jgi:hypothetical protein
MCEVLAAAFDRPRPFADLAGDTSRLERLGLGGFGWGVAWCAPGGTVELARGTGRFAEEGAADPALAAVESARFLIHLRRPSRLSTIQLADTQPFVWAGRHAFCHNGFLERAEQLRPEFAGELHGRADSEVGWAFFRRRLAGGATPGEALREVDEAFGGEVNLGYLGADGTLAMYSRHSENRLWTFALAGGRFAATGLHSDDESLFDLVFPAGTERRRIDPGGCLQLAGPLAAAA